MQVILNKRDLTESLCKGMKEMKKDLDHKKTSRKRGSLLYKNSRKDKRLCNKVIGHTEEERYINFYIGSSKRISIPRKNIISLLPALTMMIIIFIFSSKTAVKSNSSSTFIASFILQAKEKLFGVGEPGEREILLELINFIVRKAAHMTEYALLAILLSIHFYTINVSKIKYFVYNIGICVLYATSDEFHQLFVEGRSGQLSDVFIDTIGIMIGTLIFYCGSRLVIKRMNMSGKIG